MGMVDDLRGIAELADQGNHTAQMFMQWYLADSGEAEVTGTYPTDPDEQLEVNREAGNTAMMFLAARCAAHLTAHGVMPDVFTLKIAVDFDTLG